MLGKTNEIAAYSPKRNGNASDNDEQDDFNWGDYLPRLRKSLRGLHPKDLHGSIWPQKKEVPITAFNLKNIGRKKKKFDNHGSLVDSTI